MHEQLLALIDLRLRRKTLKAEDAFVNDHTARRTRNCRHRGPDLGDRLHGCRLQCSGANEQHAGTCHDAKAQSCPEFAPRTPPAELREQFRTMPEEELCLRWPSINELLWVRRKIEALTAAPDPTETVPAEDTEAHATTACGAAGSTP